jgi:hypothetical protein
MLSILGLIFQIAIAVGLLICVIGVVAALRRQRLRSWDGIMRSLTTCDMRLPQLSHHPVFSAGLDCARDEVYALIDGRRGLVGMFKNVGALLGALEYMQSTCTESRMLITTVEQLRLRALRIRLMIFVGLCQLVLPGRLRLHPLDVASVAEAYVEFVADMSLCISDYRPDLLRQYVYYIS